MKYGHEIDWLSHCVTYLYLSERSKDPVTQQKWYTA